MVGTAKPTAVVDDEAELVAALRAERGRKRAAKRAARRRRRREALHTMELEDQGGDGRSATSAAVAAVEMVDDSLHDEWADAAPMAGLMDVDEPAGAVAAESAGGAGAAAAVVAGGRRGGPDGQLAQCLGRLSIGGPRRRGGAEGEACGEGAGAGQGRALGAGERCVGCFRST